MKSINSFRRFIKKNSVRCVALIIILCITIVSVSGCKKNNKPESGTSVQDVLKESAVIESVDSLNDDGTSGSVTFSMIDLSKVYAHYSENGNVDIDESELQSFLAENVDNSDYMTQYTVDADIVKNGRKWEFSNDEAFRKAYLEQMDAIILEDIEGLGEIEIEDFPSITEEE